ncbi:hypothetical protein [Pseudothauera nasutitermitis]|nr:hypothetical protein [Pseudothauera nasutitermitis]
MMPPDFFHELAGEQRGLRAKMPEAVVLMRDPALGRSQRHESVFC